MAGRVVLAGLANVGELDRRTGCGGADELLAATGGGTIDMGPRMLVSTGRGMAVVSPGGARGREAFSIRGSSRSRDLEDTCEEGVLHCASTVSLAREACIVRSSESRLVAERVTDGR